MSRRPKPEPRPFCLACGRLSDTLSQVCSDCKPKPRIRVSQRAAWARMRKLIRIAKEAIESYDGLTLNGLSQTEAKRVMWLWFERCDKLGPFLCDRASHRLDYWAQKVLAELEFKEDAIYRKAKERRESKPRPRIKRKRRTRS